MPFYADLHVHSKYSRACSRDADLEHVRLWAGRRGLTVVGTGDFTHPAWLATLQETLVPAEPGLFKLPDETERSIVEQLPPNCRGPVRFMLSVEISTIYKRDDKTRKVHHLLYAPSLAAAEEITRRLGKIGNLTADGRPIIGLDSRDLLEITLEGGEGCYLVPAHIWTPWFAALGSKSGFDAVEDCYVDLSDHIFAVETGLSSDPEMNWRLSALDRYRLVSNSDAHSPPALGREATVFDCDMDYFAILRALRTGQEFGGTIEFFPEEGKYHLDGHRKCDVRMEPPETRSRGGLCPVCGKPVTVGVLHRVEELADRPDGTRPDGAAGFRSLVPLPEIMGEILDVGAKSKRVARELDLLVEKLGPELPILETVPVEEIRQAGGALLAEAIDRVRRGAVVRDAGYDGEYGVIHVFDPAELRPAAGGTAATLFESPEPAQTSRNGAKRDNRAHGAAPVGAAAAVATAADGASGTDGAEGPGEPSGSSGAGAGARTAGEREAEVVAAAGAADRAVRADRAPVGLDPDQAAAAAVTGGPLLILAGPGTGKTRTLTHRIAGLIRERGVSPEDVLAITFTRRAAEELHERLEALLASPSTAASQPGAGRAGAGQASGGPAEGGAAAGMPLVATFHALGLRIVREQRAAVGLGDAVRVADEADRLDIVRAVGGQAPTGQARGTSDRAVRRQLDQIARHKRADAALRAAAADGAAAAGQAGDRADPDGSVGARGFDGGAEAQAVDPSTAATAEEAGAAGPEIVELTARYQAALRERDLIDLDDLLVLPVELLAGDPELAAAYRRRWPHISVDEYQDVDELQYRLLRLLSPADGNLCAIGDPDQAIYGFRGADVGFFLRFQWDFPTATVVRLTRNYRSSPVIVDAALQAIAPSSLVAGRELHAVNPAAAARARVAVHEAASEQAEAEFVIATIDRLLGGASFHSMDTGRADGTGDLALSFSDIAVLYRTDAQAAPLLEAFARAGMPVQKRSHDRLADRPGVKAIVTALQSASQRGLPDGQRSGRQGDHHGVIDLAAGPGAAPVGGEAAPAAVPLVERLRAAARTALDAQQADAEHAPAAAAALAADVHPALELLLPLAARCEGDQERFLAELALGAEVDTWDPRADRVSLLTLHAAKGLEFPVVFIAGCEDGLLPLRFGAGSPDDDVSEERRLFFVGLTRARSHLFLTYARKRPRYGQLQEATPTPFLADIKTALLELLHGRSTAKRLPKPQPQADQLSLLDF